GSDGETVIVRRGIVRTAGPRADEIRGTCWFHSPGRVGFRRTETYRLNQTKDTLAYSFVDVEEIDNDTGTDIGCGGEPGPHRPRPRLPLGQSGQPRLRPDGATER